MVDVILLIMAIILLLLGIAGCILPLIPGPPLCFLGMLVLRFTDFVEPSRLKDYNKLLWIFAFVSIVVIIIDYIVPVWGTKHFGGSKAGAWGAAIGVIAGLFFVPFGLILGPFLGALIAERWSGKDYITSLKAGFGSLIGFLSGVAMKLSASFLMAFYFIKEVFI